jgi:Flp pilus assembly protein TadD
VSNTSTGKKTIKGRKSSEEKVVPVSPRAKILPIAKPKIRQSDIHPLDRAIAELRAELARSPDDATLMGRLGALYYRRGDLPEAEAQYRKAIALAPRRPTLYNNIGNVLCDMGRMRDGIAAYEHAIALEKAGDPDRGPSAEALVNLDLAKVENRLIHERIDYLERASQLDVSSAEALNVLGCGYLLRGWRQKALDTFRKASEMDRRNSAAGVNIAFAHTLNLAGNGDLKSALAEIAEAILRFPKETRLYIHQGELLENAGLLEEAEEKYLRALEADAHCIEAYDLLGRIREATGLTGTRDDASVAVELALKKLAAQTDSDGGDSRKLLDKAIVEVARSRFERKPLARPQAVDQTLREAILISSTPGANSVSESERAIAVRAAVLRAQLIEGDGRRNEARVVLENACKAQPENARLWFERATLALRSGEVDEAVASFDKATLAAPQEALAYHSLRFAFEGYRRYRSERVRFEAATKANPRDGLAHQHMALAALSVLKFEEALFHFTRALELDPRLSDAACGRGRALQRLGHVEEAEAAYTKALDIDPENAEAQRALVAVRAQHMLAIADRRK